MARTMGQSNYTKFVAIVNKEEDILEAMKDASFRSFIKRMSNKDFVVPMNERKFLKELRNKCFTVITARGTSTTVYFCADPKKMDWEPVQINKPRVKTKLIVSSATIDALVDKVEMVNRLETLQAEYFQLSIELKKKEEESDVLREEVMSLRSKEAAYTKARQSAVDALLKKLNSEPGTISMGMHLNAFLRQVHTSKDCIVQDGKIVFLSDGIYYHFRDSELVGIE